MKSIVIGWLAGVTLLCLNTVSVAEGVYVTKGKNGPVFSNVPQPGAKEIELKPLNVIAPPAPIESIAPNALAAPIDASVPEIGAVPLEAQKPPESMPTYRGFFVVYPENDGAVAANTAAFEVRLAVDPPLQLDRQHAFSVALNGRPVGARFTATEFMIPPEFWADRLPPDNQLIQLDATIVDGEDRVIRQAEPVRFVMRHVTFRNHQQLPDSRSRNDRRANPNLNPGSAINLPAPKPALEKPTGMVGPSADR